MSTIKPEHETIEGFGRKCIKHPQGIAATSWHRITVAVLASGQPRAYADTVYHAEVCFEGGFNSTKAGMDIPFFTKPNESKMRGLAKWLTGAIDEPGAFDTKLTKCVCIEEQPTYSVWLICAVTPYCD